jgi:ribosomal subunit interface protein
MNIEITTTRKMEITPAIRGYIEKKLSAFNKFMGKGKEDIIVRVEVGKISNRHKKGDVFKAEVSFKFEKKSLYAVSEQADLYAAVDDVKDEILSEIKKIKGKKESAVKRTPKKR